MTHNQIEFAKHNETINANRRREFETQRSNKAQELETQRSNKAQEALKGIELDLKRDLNEIQERYNRKFLDLKQDEIALHERIESRKAQLQQYANVTNRMSVQENIRHNKSYETEVQRHNVMTEMETYRHNVQYLNETQRHNLITEEQAGSRVEAEATKDYAHAGYLNAQENTEQYRPANVAADTVKKYTEQFSNVVNAVFRFAQPLLMK